MGDRMNALIAGAILIVHGLCILFVAGGEVCVIVGGMRRWRWMRPGGDESV